MSKLTDCLPKETADAIFFGVRKLRVAGIFEGATNFECNYCGQTHQGVGFGMVRGDAPVVVCLECYSNSNVSEMSIAQLEKWESMVAG
jgi:hypothetical protein